MHAGRARQSAQVGQGETHHDSMMTASLPLSRSAATLCRRRRGRTNIGLRRRRTSAASGRKEQRIDDIAVLTAAQLADGSLTHARWWFGCPPPPPRLTLYPPGAAATATSVVVSVDVSTVQ